MRRNPHARRIATTGLSVHVKPGRPKKGTETGPTIPRSVRFPYEVWRRLEERARAEGLPLHRALRAAVLAWAEAGDGVTTNERAASVARKGALGLVRSRAAARAACAFLVL